MDTRRSAYELIGEIGVRFAAVFVRVIFVLVAAAFVLLIIGGVYYFIQIIGKLLSKILFG